MNEELRNLLALVFSAGGFVGWVKGKIKSLEDKIKDIKEKLNEKTK